MLRRGDPSDILERRALVCVGCGGVGKTTIAAAVALAASAEGKRVLCLTIDPARRLASALGLTDFPTERVLVSPEWLGNYGIEPGGALTVMMLDAKSTFDELIRAHCHSEAAAERILKNRIYRHLSESLAGTRAYMAMEKLQSACQDDAFDLIVLDTPPSSRALDFFDAPTRMIETLDSPATRALVKAMAGGRRIHLNVVAAGIRGALASLGKITGASLLEEMAGLLAAMNELFGGFSERAKDVGARMRGGDFGYLLVTAPHSPSLEDAKSLELEMAQRGLPVLARIVNRMAPEAVRSLTSAELKDSGAFRALALDGGAVEPSLAAARQSSEERKREEALLTEVGFVGGRVLWVPSFSEDIHRPDRLLELGRRIVAGARHLPQQPAGGAPTPPRGRAL